MRAFIAIEISDEIREKLAALQPELARLCDMKAVEKENIHITLKFLGEINESTCEKVKEALGSLASKKFEINFKGMGAFPSQNYMRVIWAGVDGLSGLHAEIDEKMSKIGFKKEQMSAHATISRVKFVGNKEALANFIKRYENFEFGKQTVSSIHLKESTLTPKGPVYKTLFEKALL